MRVLEAFQVSETAVEKGLPCEIEYGGKVIATVWVRPSDSRLNPDYRRELADMTLAASKGKMGDIDVERDAEMLHELYCRTVITKWEFTDPADQEDPDLSFTERNACALFKKAPKFFEAIQIGSKRWDNFRQAHEEEAAGN